MTGTHVHDVLVPCPHDMCACSMLMLVYVCNDVMCNVDMQIHMFAELAASVVPCEWHGLQHITQYCPW